MSARSPLAPDIERVRIYVHDALSQWDGTTLSHCEECCDLLRTAVEGLKAIEKAFENGAVSDGDVRQEFDRLKVDIRLLTRRVDASASFWRGLEQRIDAGSRTALPANGHLALQREA